MMTLARNAFGLLLIGLACCAPKITDENGHGHAESVLAVFAAEQSTPFILESAGFEQVGLLFAGEETPSLRLRSDGQWSAPIRAQVTWREGELGVARLLLDTEHDALQVVNGRDFAEIQVELYAEQEAQPAWPLAREMPLASDTLVTDAGGLRTLRQLALPDWIITREGWGARDPSRVCGEPHTPRYITIHHTVTPTVDSVAPAARVRGIQAYHIDSNGWCDVGYHFIVGQDGRVYQGRSSELRTGAHAGGANTDNLGVSLLGTFTEDVPSDTMFYGAANIVRWISNTYNVDLTRDWLKGHREWGSTSCPGDQLFARLDRIIAEASTTDPGPEPDPDPDPDPDPEPSETYDAEIDVVLIGLTDRLSEGDSIAIVDAVPGEAFEATIALTNRSTTDLTGVELSYRLEVPYALARDYRIETDAPAYDRTSWGTDASDSDPNNPARGLLGGGGWLHFGEMAPGETKRVVITLEGSSVSADAVSPAFLRGWLRRAEGVYDLHEQWDQFPLTDQIGRHIRDDARFDTLSPWAWDFAGDLGFEGWTSCGQEPLGLGEGTLSLAAAGCAESPDWTAIDASRFDQIVVQTISDEAQTMWIQWGNGDGDPSAEVEFSIGSGTQTIVVPVGSVSAWSGIVQTVRVGYSAAAAQQTGAVELDAFWAQDAITSISTGPGYSSVEPVELSGFVSQEPDPEPDTGVDSEPDVGADASAADGGTSTYRSSAGCAVTGGPLPPFSLLAASAFGLLILRRRSSRI
ncbi:MAG: hypothetical protein ACJAYU_004323 [Bradymonadia bacterium]|jgi:hypothetical protein